AGASGINRGSSPHDGHRGATTGRGATGSLTMKRLVSAIALAMPVLGVTGTAQTTVRFTDSTRESGVSFHHVNGASPDKHLVETMGSGGLFFDYDNDGWIDLFLVDGGSLAAARVAKHREESLYP